MPQQNKSKLKTTFLNLLNIYYLFFHTLLPLPDSVTILPMEYLVRVHTLLATEPDSKAPAAPVSSNLSEGGHVTFLN